MDPIVFAVAFADLIRPLNTELISYSVVVEKKMSGDCASAALPYETVQVTFGVNTYGFQEVKHIIIGFGRIHRYTHMLAPYIYINRVFRCIIGDYVAGPFIMGGLVAHDCVHKFFELFVGFYVVNAEIRQIYDGLIFIETLKYETRITCWMIEHCDCSVNLHFVLVCLEKSVGTGGLLNFLFWVALMT
jgi:hypothetical protein